MSHLHRLSGGYGNPHGAVPDSPHAILPLLAIPYPGSDQGPGPVHEGLQVEEPRAAVAVANEGVQDVVGLAHQLLPAYGMAREPLQGDTGRAGDVLDGL